MKILEAIKEKNLSYEYIKYVPETPHLPQVDLAFWSFTWLAFPGFLPRYDGPGPLVFWFWLNNCASCPMTSFLNDVIVYGKNNL